MTKEHIEELKRDLINLGQIIRESDKLIMSMTTPELQNHYRHELLVMIDQYYILETLLRENIEEYTNWERNNGLAVDFTIRKLQKQLAKV